MYYKHLLSSCTQAGMSQMVIYRALKTKAKDTAQALFLLVISTSLRKNISSGSSSKDTVISSVT